MNPIKGQKVQIRFNNGIFFDAVVEDWSDQKSIVMLPDSAEKVIIQKTLQDVLLVKIMSNIEETKVQSVEQSNEPNVFLGHKGIHVPGLKPIVIDNSVSEEFDRLKEQPKNENNLTRMAELKDALNKLEREETVKKATSFMPSGARQVTYGIPRNISISSTSQHTEQEVASTNSDIGAELQDLFSQEY
jgi:hypothetical protein